MKARKERKLNQKRILDTYEFGCIYCYLSATEVERLNYLNLILMLKAETYIDCIFGKKGNKDRKKQGEKLCGKYIKRKDIVEFLK